MFSSRDSTSSLLRGTDELMKMSSVPKDTKKLLREFEALLSKLYELAKIHKPDIRLRPTLSVVWSPTYDISENLCE